MIVKICGITNWEDARAAVDAGAGAVGFNFYRPSPRYIHPEQAAEISRRLPVEVWKAGVFVNESRAAIESIVTAAGLDIAQLHGDETPAGYPRGVRIWKVVRVGETRPMLNDDEMAEAYLFDTACDSARGGTGRSFDWTLAAGFPARVILAGGLDAGNVAEAVRLARPWGVDACSRLEREPGVKDHERMARFIEAALAVAAC
jgi:phosphoribosylanthranilate isomerase